MFTESLYTQQCVAIGKVRESSAEVAKPPSSLLGRKTRKKKDNFILLPNGSIETSMWKSCTHTSKSAWWSFMHLWTQCSRGWTRLKAKQQGEISPPKSQSLDVGSSEGLCCLRNFHNLPESLEYWIPGSIVQPNSASRRQATCVWMLPFSLGTAAPLGLVWAWT